MISSKEISKPAVQEQFSPTIQYFIAKINNAENLDDLEAKALEFVKTDGFKASNEADEYFCQLRSNLYIDENVRQGGSGGVTGMGNLFLSFHEECAIAYVKNIMSTNHHDKTTDSKFDIEASQVKDFISTSNNFRKLTEIYNKHKPADVNGVINIVDEINNATSFHGILSSINRFDPEDQEGASNAFELIVVPRLFKTFLFF